MGKGEKGGGEAEGDREVDGVAEKSPCTLSPILDGRLVMRRQRLTPRN
jgi:hypothetical protein